MKTMPDGGSAGSEELSAEALDQFISEHTSFNDVVRELRESHKELARRHDVLQEELAAVNAELRVALAEKARTAAHLENVLGSISSGVISVDLQGCIRHFNRAAERIFGLRAEEVLNRPYADVLPTSPPCAASVLKTPHAECDGEKIYTDPAGHTRPLAVSTAVMTGVGGRVEGAVEIVSDLSRLRFLEGEILRVKTLAALGEMAATVAHEIRNPLGGIAGFAGLLAREFPEGDPRRIHADKIIRGCDNLNRIVTNLLQYAQPLRLERRHCDLRSELAEEVSVFEHDLHRRGLPIELRREFSDQRLEGFADPVQLRLALHNLLINAADAVGSGEVVCGLAPVAAEGLVTGARIWVSDNGGGVPEPHREKIFTPFFTTKDKGTGLGLATVRKVMDAHRGTVTLTHPPRGGAYFELYLPLG